jgi:phosphatidylglycerophosphate synthase
VRKLPLLLTLLRAALAPVVVLLAFLGPSKAAFGACLVAALLSDVFDGVIARRLGVATPNLRRLDSVADSLFYAAATFAAWHLYPAAITRRLLPLAVLVALELTRYGFDAVKFHREASYHMWSSRLWGAALFAAFFSLLALGLDTMLIPAAIAIGIVADLEGLAISIVLRDWRNDVPTVLHAIRLRRGPGDPLRDGSSG